jgi:hypothetical protein
LQNISFFANTEGEWPDFPLPKTNYLVKIKAKDETNKFNTTVVETIIVEANKSTLLTV